MRTSRRLLSASLAAIVPGCQTQPRTGAIDELPNNNPTSTSADPATGD